LESLVYNSTVAPAIATWAKAPAKISCKKFGTLKLGIKRLSVQAKKIINKQWPIRLKDDNSYTIQRKFNAKYTQKGKNYDTQQHKIEEMKTRISKLQDRLLEARKAFTKMKNNCG
jgi:uncharacterized lipoprotein YmbA